MACAFVAGPRRGIASAACAFAIIVRHGDALRTEWEWVGRGLRLRPTHGYANDVARAVLVTDVIEGVEVIIAADDEHITADNL